MMTISLDFHDFSILRSRLDLLLKLKEHYPELKVSMFTIPFDADYEMATTRVFKDKFRETIKANNDWLQIIPHGIVHAPGEFFRADKHTMRMYTDNVIAELEKEGYSNIEKGFCAPNWLWNQDVIDVLNERGWWGAVDRNQPQMLRPNKFYEYNYSISEPFWEDKDKEVLKLHGHMTLPSENNLEDCFINLMKMPRDAKFVFASELVEDKNAAK